MTPASVNGYIVERVKSGGLRRSTQHGFSLIEVLVSLLIFSIGLLGIAGLQAKVLASVQESRQRLHATEFAHKAISSMWLLPDAELGSFATGQPRFESWLNGVKDPVNGLAGLDESRTSIDVEPGGNVTISIGWKSVTDRGTAYAGANSSEHLHVMQTRIRHE